MTGPDDLTTADLASPEARDREPRRDDVTDPDVRDDDLRDADLRDDDLRDDDREAARREVGLDDDPGVVSAGGAPATTGPLMDAGDAEGFRARWTDVQTAFVDSPRQSVEQADALVAEVMQHLAKTFADERSDLERQWDRGDDIATDDLRNAFQRYRSFFERLLAT